MPLLQNCPCYNCYPQPLDLPPTRVRAGEYDLRGVRGNEPGIDARFQRIRLEGTFETDMSQEELDRIAQQVRHLAAAAVAAAGRCAARQCPDIPAWTDVAPCLPPWNLGLA